MKLSISGPQAIALLALIDYSAARAVDRNVIERDSVGPNAAGSKAAILKRTYDSPGFNAGVGAGLESGLDVGAAFGAGAGLDAGAHGKGHAGAGSGLDAGAGLNGGAKGKCPSGFKPNGSGKDGFQLDILGKGRPAHLPSAFLYFGSAIGWAPPKGWVCDTDWKAPPGLAGTLGQVKWWVPPSHWKGAIGFDIPSWWKDAGFQSSGSGSVSGGGKHSGHLPPASFHADGSGTDGWKVSSSGETCPHGNGWLWFGSSGGSSGWLPPKGWSVPSLTWTPPSGFKPDACKWWSPPSDWKCPVSITPPAWWPRKSTGGSTSSGSTGGSTSGHGEGHAGGSTGGSTGGSSSGNVGGSTGGSSGGHGEGHAGGSTGGSTGGSSSGSNGGSTSSGSTGGSSDGHGESHAGGSVGGSHGSSSAAHQTATAHPKGPTPIAASSKTQHHAATTTSHAGGPATTPSAEWKCNGSGTDGWKFSSSGETCPYGNGWLWFGSSGWLPPKDWSVPSLTWTPPSGFKPDACKWWSPPSDWKCPVSITPPAWWPRKSTGGSTSSGSTGGSTSGHGEGHAGGSTGGSTGGSSSGNVGGSTGGSSGGHGEGHAGGSTGGSTGGSSSGNVGGSTGGSAGGHGEGHADGSSGGSPSTPKGPTPVAPSSKTQHHTATTTSHAAGSAKTPAAGWKCDGSGNDGHKVDNKGASCPYGEIGFFWFGEAVGWQPPKGFQTTIHWGAPSAWLHDACKATWWHPVSGWHYPASFSPPSFWKAEGWIGVEVKYGAGDLCKLD